MGDEERFATAGAVQSHGRLDGADPYRISDTKAEPQERIGAAEQQPEEPAAPADAPGFRETSVGAWPRRAVVRTEQTGGSARLEREHTKAVRETLLALHVQNVDAHEADEIAAVHSREWPDKEGFPGSGERARNETLQNFAEHAARARKRTSKAPRTNWDDARKGWPAVRFNLDVTDPRISEYHEYAPEPVATPAAPELSPPAEPDTAAPAALPVPEGAAATAEAALATPAVVPGTDSGWPSDPYGTPDLLADIGFPFPERIPTPDDTQGAAAVPEPDPSEVPEGQMAFDEAAPEPLSPTAGEVAQQSPPGLSNPGPAAQVPTAAAPPATSEAPSAAAAPASSPPPWCCPSARSSASSPKTGKRPLSAPRFRPVGSHNLPRPPLKSPP